MSVSAVPFPCFHTATLYNQDGTLTNIKEADFSCYFGRGAGSAAGKVARIFNGTPTIGVDYDPTQDAALAMGIPDDPNNFPIAGDWIKVSGLDGTPLGVFQLVGEAQRSTIPGIDFFVLYLSRVTNQ